MIIIPLKNYNKIFLIFKKEFLNLQHTNVLREVIMFFFNIQMWDQMLT